MHIRPVLRQNIFFRDTNGPTSKSIFHTVRFSFEQLQEDFFSWLMLKILQQYFLIDSSLRHDGM